MGNDIKKKILEEVQRAIKEENIKQAKALLKGYLSYNKKDPEVSSMLAKIYEQEGKLKEALEILKEQNPNYFCVFQELVQIYIKLQKYEKLYNLWNKSKDRNFQDLKTKKDLDNAKRYLIRTALFLKSFINRKIEVSNINLNYKEQQYLKYSHLKALEHIKERHTSKTEIPTSNATSIFFNCYDLEELLLAVSRNIEFEKREIKLRWNFSDTYIFAFKKIGRDEYNTRNLNYFRVATIPNTNKIITMFPIYNKTSSNLCQITEEDKLSICNPIVHTDKVYRVKTYSLK